MVTKATTKSKPINAVVASERAKQFAVASLGAEQVRVTGLSMSPEGNWSVDVETFVINPNLSVENNGLRRSVLDKLQFRLGFDSTGELLSLTESDT